MATIKISQLGNISAVTSITDETLIPLVGNVLGTLTTLKSNIGEIKPYILGTTTTDIANVAADVAGLDSNLSSLTNTVSNNISNIASLQNSVVGITANVGVLQSEVDAVEANVLILQGNVETINSDVDAVEANVSILQEDIAAAEGNIGSLQSGVDSLTTSLINIVTGVTSFGNLIPSIDSEYDLGTSYAHWRDLYLSGTSIYLGNTAITSENNILKFSLANAIPEGNRVEWQVSNDGGLVFPDGTVQFSANVGSGGGASSQLINGNAAITLNADGTVTLPDDPDIFEQQTLNVGEWGLNIRSNVGIQTRYSATQATLDEDPDAVAYSQVALDYAGCMIWVNKISTSKVWEFQPGGNLMLPQGGTIVDYLGADLLGGGGGGTSNQLVNGNVAITLNADGTVVLPNNELNFGNVWGTIKSIDSGVVLNYTATQTALDADPDIVATSEVWVDGYGFTIQNLDRTSEIQHTWQFLNTGNLLIPDTGTIVNSQGDNLLSLIRSYDAGADITTEAMVGYGYVDGYIGADVGTMLLNANVSVIELKKNNSRIVSEELGAGLTIDGNGYFVDETFYPNPVTIQTQPDFEVSQAQRNTWIFNTVGEMEFPDASIQSTAYRGGEVASIESSNTVTPDANVDGNIDVTALATDLTIANPTGTARNFQRLIIRIVDNGTPRTLTFDTDYIPGGESLPTTTVANKTLTLEFMYNSANSLNKWMLILKAQEA